MNASAFRSLLWHIPYYSMEDPLHANAVEYLDQQRAQWLRTRIPAAAEGQVLVSFREMAGGTVALIDLDRGEAVWASRGPWIAQHDPDVLPGGTLLVFDNRGNLGARTKSRVLEVDPATMGIVWRYAGDREHPLDSPIRASQQRLPNGNTLITESSGGRLLEVTREGRLVWEYINPVRGGDDDSLIPVVSWAQRIPAPALPASFIARLNGD
jgi:outer membrane protein assembly factor BamB